MKKSLVILFVTLFSLSLFAISYKNNTYQKLADEYTKKAEIALDAGQYDDAVEYSKKAEENAALSKAYIALMMERKSAEDNIKLAKNPVESRNHWLFHRIGNFPDIDKSPCRFG